MPRHPSAAPLHREEILLILVLPGTAALHYWIPIGLAVAVLIAAVVSSYRQTILAYPLGGGSYIVTKDNLGTLPELISGGALLIDYVLTVAVSVAARVAALTSAAPGSTRTASSSAWRSSPWSRSPTSGAFASPAGSLRCRLTCSSPASAS